MYLACRDDILTWAGFRDIHQGLKELSISSFELNIPRDFRLNLRIKGEDKLLQLTNREDLKAFKKSLESLQISVCACLIENDFAREPLTEEVKYTSEGCRISEALGVDVVRINAVMSEKPNLSLQEHVDLAVKPIMKVLKGVEGVELAVENHGLMVNKREFLKELFEKASSERLGLTLDTGNFYWYGYPASEVLEIIEEFAHKVKHTHIKNGRALGGLKETRRQPRQIEMTPLYEGDVDLKKAVAILKRAGYKRDLTVEDESLDEYKPEERREILKKDIEYVKTLIE